MKKLKLKIVHVRHAVFAKIANFLLSPFIRFKTGFRAKRLNIKNMTPYLIVANHVTAFDPILLSGVLDEQIYYVASELIFSKGFISRLLEYTFSPIPKSKSQNDPTTIKTMIRIVKQGGSVGVFVEGNSTMTGAISNVPAAIGKLVLLLKIPLVIFNFTGGYLSDPRWSRKSRKKSRDGYIKEIIPYQAYKHLTPEELNKIIIDGININAYDDTINFKYIGKRNAEGLERLVFTCPNCKGVNTGITTGNDYICTACNFIMHYDQHGYLHSAAFDKPKTTIELDYQNKLNYQEHIISNKTFKIEAQGRWLEIYQRRRKLLGKAKVIFTPAGLHVSYRRKRLEERFYPLDELDTIVMQQKEVVIIYPKNEQTKALILPKSSSVSAYQFVITMQIFKHLAATKEDAVMIKLLNADQMGL